MNTRGEVSSTTHANLSATAHNVPPTHHLCHAVTYPYPSCAGVSIDACPAAVLCHGDVGLSTHTEGEWVSGESHLHTRGLVRGASERDRTPEPSPAQGWERTTGEVAAYLAFKL
jgi:hypothetical protein